MGLLSLFQFKSLTSCDSELPEIFPLALKCDVFTKSDIIHTYVKILTDTIERTHGITEKVDPLLWDSCVQSEASTGLVSLLAEAMYSKRELFLVYRASVGVLRVATHDESALIRAGYLKKSEAVKLPDGGVGVFVSFKNYQRTDMLLIYSVFEYCVLGSLNKTLNLSKAVQIKINDLRSSVALNDSAIAHAQMVALAGALAKGKDIGLDAKDIIETAKPDTSSTEKAIAFLDAKKAFLLGLPMSYISGLQTAGIGSTGEADMRAVERGLRQYYVSIVRPVLEAIFTLKTEFKSQDFREMGTALDVVKTFELIAGSEIISKETMQIITARVFNLDPAEEKKKIDAEEKDREAEETERVKAEAEAKAERPDGTETKA